MKMVRRDWHLGRFHLIKRSLGEYESPEFGWLIWGFG